MLVDAQGLPLTTESTATVELYNEVVHRYIEYRLSAMEPLKQILAADEDFVMARCLQGYLFMLLATHKLDSRVGAALEFCRAHSDGLSERESQHVDALEAWWRGDLVRACALWEHILTEHPHDLLALRILHLNTFWMGNNYFLRDSAARVLPVWNEAIPGYATVLGMYAFGLEECGEYETAERYGRLAVEHNPDDLWAIHAVAHVLEMQGRVRDGLEWLDYPADQWDDRNPFKGHLWWHRTLYLLEAGDYEQVLEHYDRSVRPEPSEFYLDIQNAASMLMRLELLGVDVGERWSELADVVEARIGDHTLAFNEMHSMMALGADARFDAAERLLDSLRAFAAEPDNFAAAVTEPAVVPLCEAVLGYFRQDYDQVVDTLLRVRYHIAGVGGSHAQRDVFTLILIGAARRAGRHALALSLLRERVTARDHSVGSWRQYGEELQRAGDPEAERAVIRAAALLEQ